MSNSIDVKTALCNSIIETILGGVGHSDIALIMTLTVSKKAMVEHFQDKHLEIDILGSEETIALLSREGRSQSYNRFPFITNELLRRKFKCELKADGREGAIK